jgi:hypothetical protein
MIAALIWLVTLQAAPCERKALEQGQGTVLVCKAGVL